MSSVLYQFNKNVFISIKCLKHIGNLGMKTTKTKLKKTSSNNKTVATAASASQLKKHQHKTAVARQ